MAQARGGVHGDVDGDEIGGANRGFVERVAGNIEARDFVAVGAKPCGRRSQAEGLVALLISGD